MDYNSLLLFFKQYNEHYRDFLAFELKKMKLVAEDDIQGLTDSIKTEQALIMKTNVTNIMIISIVSLLFSMPNRCSNPPQIWLTPRPSEVAIPANDTTTEKPSIILPNHPSVNF